MLHRLGFFLALFFVLREGFAHPASEDASPANEQAERTGTGSQSLANNSTDLLARFRAAASRVPESLQSDAQQDFVAGLSADERTALAELLVDSEVPTELWLATSIYLDARLDMKAAAAIANVAKSGPVDFGRFTWGPMHGTRGSLDLTRLIRLYVAAARILLPEIDTLKGTQRANAIAFVSDGGFKPRLESFSTQTAQERLDLLSTAQ